MAFLTKPSLLALSGCCLAALSTTGVLGTTAAWGQQANPLRPALDVNATENAPTNNETTTTNGQLATAIPRTNAPVPIRLLSNQPEQLPPPPPPPPRRQPEETPYEPVGIKTGGLILFPSLEISGVLSDNASSSNTGKRADYGLRLSPSVRIESDWARHSYTFNASSDHTIFAKSNDANENTVSATGTFRLDIRRNTNLTTTTSYALSQTSSASSEVPGTAIGDRNDHELSFTTALSHRLNRFVGTLTAGATWQFFEKVKLAGGGFENNNDREFVEPTATFRLGYEVSPSITPFVQVGYSPRIHKKRFDRNGVQRDSHGVTAQTGFGFNLSPIWDGEIAATYEHRNFKDATLANINAFGLNATINWRPSDLTTIAFTSTTSVEESSAVGVSGTRNYNLALNASHRFKPNLTGTLDLGFNYNDFVGATNDDMFYTVQTGIAYALNRKIEWTAQYQFTHFNSGTAGNDFTENRVTTGLRFRL